MRRKPNLFWDWIFSWLYSDEHCNIFTATRWNVSCRHSWCRGVPCSPGRPTGWPADPDSPEAGGSPAGRGARQWSLSGSRPARPGNHLGNGRPARPDLGWTWQTAGWGRVRAQSSLTSPSSETRTGSPGWSGGRPPGPLCWDNHCGSQRDVARSAGGNKHRRSGTNQGHTPPNLP